MKKINLELQTTILNQRIMNKKYLSGLLAILGIAISFIPMAKAEYIQEIRCSSTGQVCNNTADYTFKADGRSYYELNIKAPARHCSAVKYSLSWRTHQQRRRTATTRFLEREESVTIPLDYKFSRGNHVITIGATGKEGGCNAGSLGAWGVEINASPRSSSEMTPESPPESPPESTPDSTPQVIPQPTPQPTPQSTPQVIPQSTP